MRCTNFALYINDKEKIIQKKTRVLNWNQIQKLIYRNVVLYKQKYTYKSFLWNLISYFYIQHQKN